MTLILKILNVFERKEKLQLLGILLLTLVGSVMEAIGVGAILPIIALISDKDFLVKYPLALDFFSFWGLNTYKSIILASTTGLLVFFLAKSLYLLWLNKVQVSFTAKKQAYYASLMMQLYLGRPYLYHVEKNSAELIRNINNNVRDFFSGMLNSAFMLITESLTIITIWLALMLIDPFMAIIVFGVIGLTIYILLSTTRTKLNSLGKNYQDIVTEVNKSLYQGLGAIKETKAMGKESCFVDAFKKYFKMQTDVQVKYTIIAQLPRFFIENVVMAGLLLMVIYKVAVGGNVEQIVPVLSTVAVAAFRIMPSANRLTGQINSLRYMEPLLDTIYDDLIYIKNNKGQLLMLKANEQLGFEQEINIKNIGFAYPKSESEVLRDISFTIKKGAFIGIIGESGAGKTTFVDVLLGLLTPNHGFISVDNKDIQQHMDSWHNILAYVPQSIYLLDGTIKENIALGEATENMSETKIEHVLKMAELYDFVLGLPDGINTKVGEHGVKLSGGQRQRIGIARALYRAPQVLVLDEATSALDSHTEQNIMDTVLKLKGEITIIAVAHRLSTLEKCDFKVRIAAGKAEIV